MTDKTDKKDIANNPWNRAELVAEKLAGLMQDAKLTKNLDLAVALGLLYYTTLRKMAGEQAPGLDKLVFVASEAFEAHIMGDLEGLLKAQKKAYAIIGVDDEETLQ